MNLIFRRVLTGLVCGTVSSPFLCLAVRDIGLGASLGALLGIAICHASRDLIRITRIALSSVAKSVSKCEAAFFRRSRTRPRNAKDSQATARTMARLHYRIGL
jgi:hypothetical protein